MILFGWLGTIPACPFDQSYETAYAKMLPVRLNAVAVIGPGDWSNATEPSQTVSYDRSIAERDREEK